MRPSAIRDSSGTAASGANLNFVARQPFDVEQQQMPHGLERESIAAAAQRVIAAACFQREITAARACIFVVRGQTLARPLFELLDRNCPQRHRARTKTGERCFAVSLRDFARQLYYSQRQVGSRCDPLRSRERAHKPRTAANKSNQARVSMLGHCPQ